MTENTIFVFIPDTLEKSNVGFLSGFVINNDNQSEFYITRDRLKIDPTNCIGYCGMSTNFSKLNWIHINYYDETLKVNEIACTNNEDYRLVFVIYDYFLFRNSEIVHLSSISYGNHFNNLCKSLKIDNEVKSVSKIGVIKRVIFNSIISHLLKLILVFINSILIVLTVLGPLLNISSTFLLIQRTFLNLQWAFDCILKDRKICLKAGNIISSKVVDVIVGIMVIFFVSNYEIDLNAIFNETTKELISDLQELLKFLMGSPVGLKLNHAFNNALGHFFLYHITLWKTFLIVTNPFLKTTFTIVYWLATLGFSFQAALAADIFNLATFHVYCIYVYAARLYGVQMHGLLSLWKLFLGRKYNPLRKRVDSCQYSHHQLFIGTLGFTILLFLLPTTMLYYFVFITGWAVINTIFGNIIVFFNYINYLRLLLISCDELLRFLRRTTLRLPLYVTWLWIFNSSRTKGSVYLRIADQKKDSATLTLQAVLKTDSWIKCVNGTCPEYIEIPGEEQKSFKELLRSIVIGDLV